MRRIRRVTVGTLLALGVVGPVLWTSAQAPKTSSSGQPAQVEILDVLPDALPAKTLEAQEGELRLPIVVPPKQAAAKVSGEAKSLTEDKLPLKWSRPTESWETQAKKLEAVNDPKARSQIGRDTKALPKSTFIAQDPVLRRPAETTTTRGPKAAEMRADAARDMTWRRPGSSEQSEPNSVAETEDKSAPQTPLPTLRSVRHWPPAYVSQPPTNKGRPGAILFEEELSPVSTKPAASANVVPADLQFQVRSVCGSQARAVSVTTQRDGTVLVTVKVANRSIENKLSQKILAIPDMTEPKVRLLVDVGP